MALMNCPECQKEISDKVKDCPHCGYPLVEDLTEIQKVEITSVNLKKMDKNKKIKIVLSSLVILALIVLSVGSYIIYNDSQNKKAEKEYLENLNTVMESMLISAQSSEELLNLTGQVWYNTIYKKSDSTTDKFTKDSYRDFVDDFNTSLANLYSDKETKDKIDGIKNKQSTIESLIKKLQNPPSIYIKSFDTLIELNSSYQGLTDLAMNPKGNLTSFSTNKTEKIDGFLELYKKLETLMPNKE